MAKRRKKDLTPFGKQVQNILDKKDITQTQLGELTNLSQSTISGMFSRNNIGYETMLKAANALGYEISLELVPVVNKSDLDTDITTIPISIVAAGAGISTKFTIDNAFEKKTFTSNDVPSDADCGIRINGDSMSPDYPDGCIVWVKQTTEVKYGDKVIAILNGCPYFKIYDREGLRSINPEYPIIKVYDDDKFSVFGKVIGVYTENIK